MVRCVNLDWLEVFCQEPKDEPRDANYFRAHGYEVEIRDYGTPQYREMFTIKESGNPLLEIRRSPYSLKEAGGIFNPNDCHIRLSNRSCYLTSPVDLLRKFIWENNYTFQSLSRVDICLDLLNFDDGQEPGIFLQRYAKGDFFKQHLSKISPHGVEVVGSDFEGHGTDGPYMREFNSWKWGAPSSAISVKLYNKTKELGEVHEKTYIRDQWLSAGLINEDDRKLMSATRDVRYYIGQLSRNIKKAQGEKKLAMRARLQEYKKQLLELSKAEKQVWRIEFSITSDIKGFISGDENDLDNFGHRRIYPFTLSTIDNRGKCLYLFHSLASRYFLFKQKVLNRNGRQQRKDRCPDYLPIKLLYGEQVYRPTRIVDQPAPSRMDKIIVNKLRRIVDDNNENPKLPQNIVASIIDVLQYFRQLYHFDELDKVVNKAIMFQERILQKDISTKQAAVEEVARILNDIENLNEIYNV